MRFVFLAGNLFNACDDVLNATEIYRKSVAKNQSVDSAIQDLFLDWPERERDLLHLSQKQNSTERLWGGKITDHLRQQEKSLR